MLQQVFPQILQQILSADIAQIFLKGKSKMQFLLKQIFDLKRCLLKLVGRIKLYRSNKTIQVENRICEVNSLSWVILR